MANGTNPYLASNVKVLSDLAQTSAKKDIQEAFSETGIQKGKLKKQFTKEQEEALARFKKKSKGGIFGALSKFSPLLGMFSPLAGALASGIGTAGVGIETRKAAKDLPGMEGWKTTFLSDPARKQESFYKDLKKSAPSILDSLVKGAISGVTAHEMGKATQSAFKGDESINIFGKGAKKHGKFFERLKKKYKDKPFFQELQSGLKKSDLLDANWLKLLQTYPELSKGDLTDAVSVISGMGQEYGSKEELDAAREAGVISEEAYEKYLEQLF